MDHQGTSGPTSLAGDLGGGRAVRAKSWCRFCCGDEVRGCRRGTGIGAVDCV